MIKHPLTDQICKDLVLRFYWSSRPSYPDRVNEILCEDIDPDDMRTAADWQLKQCEDEVSHMLALMVLSRKINREEKIGLLETFMSHMRPTTTEEDS